MRVRSAELSSTRRICRASCSVIAISGELGILWRPQNYAVLMARASRPGCRSILTALGFFQVTWRFWEYEDLLARLASLPQIQRRLSQSQRDCVTVGTVREISR